MRSPQERNLPLEKQTVEGTMGLLKHRLGLPRGQKAKRVATPEAEGYCSLLLGGTGAICHPCDASRALNSVVNWWI